ncbi:HK97 family phage prohead protease [Nocardioides sp. NBC_00368]|uniref:HK97 family phage prohead protease n=1 Tax=Nocardioides sp. NBC_00368 TaxID=2976000 RepID=UPI002E1C580A
MTDLQFRAFSEPLDASDEAVIRGIAVPFNEIAPGIEEAFIRNAIPDGIEVPVYAEHDHLDRGLPIGTAVGKNGDTGYEIEVRLAETTKATEVRALAKAGALKHFSVGFKPIDSEMVGDVVVRKSVELREVSLVATPAYKGAVITEVRSEAPAINSSKEENNMTDTVSEDLIEVRSELEALQRLVAVQTEVKGEVSAPIQFRSGGEALKALAAGDENAKTLFRAADATGPAVSTQAGVGFGGNGWVAKQAKLVDEKRPLIGFFSNQSLPAFGNTVEYPVVSGTNGTVAAQSAEGANLPYMEIELGSDSAPVKTYGGYSSLTRQAIERGDSVYLSKVLEYQGLQYAKATEAAFRTGVLAAGVTHTTVADLSASTKNDWLLAALGAAGDIEDDSLGLQADALIVSRDVYIHLAQVMEWDFAGNGQSFIGRGGVVRQAGLIGDLPVAVVKGLPALTAFVASSEAYESFESAGAPFRLQDENIINLTKDFSLYGYMAHGEMDAAGIQKIAITAA